MTYDFNHYESQGLQEKIEAFDKLCEAMGYAYSSKEWSRLYVLVAKNNTSLAEGILEYQQSGFSRTGTAIS